MAKAGFFFGIVFDLNFFRICISKQHRKGCLLPLLKRKKAQTLDSGTMKLLRYVLKYTSVIRSKLGRSLS